MAATNGLLKKPHPSTVLRTNGLETESDVYHSAHGELRRTINRLGAT